MLIALALLPTLSSTKVKTYKNGPLLAHPVYTVENFAIAEDP